VNKDEEDLSKIHFELERFEMFTKGFSEQAKTIFCC